MKTHSAMSNVASLTFNKLTLSLSLAIVILTGCDSQRTQQPEQESIIRPALIQTVIPKADSYMEFNGVVRSAQRAELSFQVGGQVSYIFVNEGDSVQKGQLLAKLDPIDAQTTFAAAQLELNNAKKDYQRGQAIFESSQAIAKSDLDQLKVRYNLAQNRLEDAKNKLTHTQLIAPFDGIIGRKLVNSHVQIQANSPVLTLQNIDDLEVVINITDKVMISGVRCKKAVAKINNIADLQLPLSLRTYSTQADPDTQTFSIVLGFDDLKGLNVLPGMAVKVTPDLQSCPQSNTNPLIVPLTAVVPDNKGKQFVWIVNNDNQVVERYITVGKLYKDSITVLDGLTAGERIVIAGVSKLTAGMEVRPYTDNTGA